MCIGRPLRVVEAREFSALCAGADGAQEIVDMSLVGPQPTGTWVLVFLGHARTVLDPEEAERIGDALAALDSVMRGEAPDVDRLFADLVNGEPGLPAHLHRSDAVS
jgi:hydrogenase expression/formation protein HypC